MSDPHNYIPRQGEDQPRDSEQHRPVSFTQSRPPETLEEAMEKALEEDVEAQDRFTTLHWLPMLSESESDYYRQGFPDAPIPAANNQLQEEYRPTPTACTRPPHSGVDDFVDASILGPYASCLPADMGGEINQDDGEWGTELEDTAGPALLDPAHPQDHVEIAHQSTPSGNGPQQRYHGLSQDRGSSQPPDHALPPTQISEYPAAEYSQVSPTAPPCMAPLNDESTTPSDHGGAAPSPTSPDIGGTGQVEDQDNEGGGDDDDDDSLFRPLSSSDSDIANPAQHETDGQAAAVDSLQLVRGLGPRQQETRDPSAPGIAREFRIYVGEQGNKTLLHTVRLSTPGQLEDFDGIDKADLKIIRDDSENAAWHSEVSQAFWRKVMEYNLDILPPDTTMAEKIYTLLCRSNILIEDLWTAHQVYKSMVLPIQWRGNGEPSLLRLKYWMSRDGDNSTWRTTLAAKRTDYERCVPWIPRERLIALCILLRKGHHEDLVTVAWNGAPFHNPKLKQSQTMARKKMALLSDCKLTYQCVGGRAGDTDDPALSCDPYWAGFREALEAGEVRVWDESSVARHKAEDEDAKLAYEIEDKIQTRHRQAAAASSSGGKNGQPQPRVVTRGVSSRRRRRCGQQVSGEASSHTAGEEAGGGVDEEEEEEEENQNGELPSGVMDTSSSPSAVPDANSCRGGSDQDRVRVLEAQVAELRVYVRSMYTHLASRLKDVPTPPPGWV